MVLSSECLQGGTLEYCRGDTLYLQSCPPYKIGTAPQRCSLPKGQVESGLLTLVDNNASAQPSRARFIYLKAGYLRAAIPGW